MTVSYKERPDFSREGHQQVILVLKDAGGNKTELTANLTLEKDTVPPLIEGAGGSLYPDGDETSGLQRESVCVG